MSAFYISCEGRAIDTLRIDYTMSASPFQKGDKIVAYCRYSEGDEQGLKNTSTDEQEQAIRKFCEENGLEVVRVFADPFASGRSVQGRDHYLEMLSFLLHKKKPDVQGVVLWDYERYGRNYDQAQLDSTRLRMAGYKIYSLQQPIADNSPFSHVLEAMYYASAQNQSDMISADVKRALQYNFLNYRVIPRSCIPDGWRAVPVSMGVYSDGSPRTGYKAEPDPDIAPMIRQAIEARLQGKPTKEVKHLLPSVISRNPAKVEKLFCKPLLYGSMTYGGTTIEDYCEPIIDKTTFDKLQTVNTAVKRKIRKQGAGAYSADRPLLSGFCRCGVCGKGVYIERRKANGKLYETYYCDDKHSNWRKTVLDELVISATIDLLTGEKWDDMKHRLLKTEPEDKPADYNQHIQFELARIESQIEKITEAIAQAGALRGLVLKLQALEMQRDEHLSTLKPETPKNALSVASAMDSLRDSVLSVIKDEKSSTDDRRTALSLFVRSVITFPDGHILIRYTLPIFGGEMSGDFSAPPEEVGTHPQILDVPVWLTPPLFP